MDATEAVTEEWNGGRVEEWKSGTVRRSSELPGLW